MLQHAECLTTDACQVVAGVAQVVALPPNFAVEDTGAGDTAVDVSDNLYAAVTEQDKGHVASWWRGHAHTATADARHTHSSRASCTLS